MILYNLDWLKKGEVFPPEGEVERLDRYADNKKIFENRHGEVYEQQLRRIEKVLGNYSEVISYPIVLNFQKKISLKTADFLFIEPPTFSCEDAQKNDAVLNIVESSQLLNIGYQGVIDCSRYGTAVYKIETENGGRISISSPEYLFIVCDKDNRKSVLYYVLAWKVKEDEREFLRAFVHEKGRYSEYQFALNNGIIGEVIHKKIHKKTGLSDFAIVPVHNILTSDSVWGIDDYLDVDSIVSEIEIRTAQISKILDVHANPTVSGSFDALEKNQYSGKYQFKAGSYYPRNSVDEPPLEYITWEASLESNFKQIDKLLNYLSVISEMGAAIFDGDLKTGNLPSGSALKRLYINVLAKVSRVKTAFDEGFKKAISLACECEGVQVLTCDIDIIWQDGLPNDPKEVAEIISIRTGGKPTMSIERALNRYDHLSNVQEEMGRISNDLSKNINNE